MNERYGWIGAACGRAFVLVCAAVLVLTATAALLTRAGMPFAGAYTGGVLVAAVGTLIVSRNGATRVLLPSQPSRHGWSTRRSSRAASHGRMYSLSLPSRHSLVRC